MNEKPYPEFNSNITDEHKIKIDLMSGFQKVKEESKILDNFFESDLMKERKGFNPMMKGMELLSNPKRLKSILIFIGIFFSIGILGSTFLFIYEIIQLIKLF